MVLEALSLTLLGIGTLLSLIVAIGAQNVFLLKQGIIGNYVAPIVLFCIFSDVLLIGIGVVGVGKLSENASWVLEVLRWGGGAFLIWYGLSALKRAIRPATVHIEPDSEGPRSLGSALAITFAITYLNPHVYLDTVVLLGSIANTHGEQGRWWFYLGCVLGSTLWFTLLGYGSKYLRPVFASEIAWRILDALIAAIMFFLAVRIMFAS